MGYVTYQSLVAQISRKMVTINVTYFTVLRTITVMGIK